MRWRRSSGRIAMGRIPASRWTGCGQRTSRVLAEVAPGDAEAVKALDVSIQRARPHPGANAVGQLDRDYDQIVSQGEIWSTLIVSAHSARGRHRQHLVRCARISCAPMRCSVRHAWTGPRREQLAQKQLEPRSRRRPAASSLRVSSAARPRALTTTLGREGSDFSAAIFAYLLDAESVTIWKDVPGMFNADPKVFPGYQAAGAHQLQGSDRAELLRSERHPSAHAAATCRRRTSRSTCAPSST